MSNKWLALKVCKACSHELSRRDYMYSSGVCPYCGNITKGTIVDYTVYAVRIELQTPWWKFWGVKYKTIYRND